MESLRKSILVDGFHLQMSLEKSVGSFVFDELSGRKLLDFYTSFASCPIGYNHPQLTLDRLVFPNKIANSDIYTAEYVDFVEAFRETIPEELRTHLFFVEGGSAAVENGLKAAFDWKIQKSTVAENDLKVIHFVEAFHGRTGYTLSLTNTDPIKTVGFPKFSWPRCINPKLHYRCGLIDNLLEVVEQENLAIDQVMEALKLFPGQIAALIIEPIQSEGGDNHFRPEFLYRLRKLADKYEFLLIFDEVQTGFGATGKMWCCQHAGILPDILVFGKKTQVCGIAASRRLDEVQSVFSVSSRINSTWGGNLVDMVRCTQIIRVYHRQGVVENAERVGRYLLDGLIELERRGSPISNCRGLGMLLAFDLSDGDVRDQFMKDSYAEGLICLKCGPRSIRFRPPLNLSISEADLGLSIITRVLAKLH